MSGFANAVGVSVEGYITLQHSLGYQFRKQTGVLRAFQHYVRSARAQGPLTQALAIDFVMSGDRTPNGRAISYGIIRRFAEYYAAFDARTESLDPRALPRSRAVPPPRILTDEELRSLMEASDRISVDYPFRGRTLATLIGLLASTGLRSGEALRLDRSDADLTTGVLLIRKTKFRKDRLVPVHPTTLAALRHYARCRDRAFPAPRSPAFFIGTRGNRLGTYALYYGFEQACTIAALNRHTARALRPHDLRHRFAVTRLALWHRQKVDIQPLLPVLATYLGHARYSDTAYYITATAELLGLASENAFRNGGVS
jgi:integrase